MKPRACSCGMISAGELIYNQPRSAVQTGSPSQQTYRKRTRFLTGSGRGPAKFFRGLRARNFMKPPFKNPTSATVVRSCCAHNCTARDVKSTREAGVQFYRFPQNEAKRTLWVNAVNRKSFRPNASTVICSQHFVGGK